MRDHYELARNVLLVLAFGFYVVVMMTVGGVDPADTSRGEREE